MTICIFLRYKQHIVYGSLMLIDGDYYYARTSDPLTAGKAYWIIKANDLLSTSSYQTDTPVRSYKDSRLFRRKIDRLFFFRTRRSSLFHIKNNVCKLCVILFSN